MKPGYPYVLWLVLILSVITAAALLAIITDISLFETTPFLYTFSVGAATTGLALAIRNRSYLPMLKELQLQGRLLISALTLLILSVPASLIYIYYDLNGKETLKLLSALFISLAAIFFFASFLTYTLPALAAISQSYAEEGTRRYRFRNLRARTIATITLLLVFFILVKRFTGYNSSGLVLLIPLFALIQVILDIILSAEFRNNIMARIRSLEALTKPAENQAQSGDVISGFRSVLLYPSHYLDIICGKLDYLINRADDSYASEVARVASRTFDPALIPALKTIVSGQKFSEVVRHEASGVIAHIEKYFSDPVRNSEMLRLPGINEKTAVARAILTGKKAPQTSEINRMLNDLNPDIRRIGLAAAGKYGMKELREEALQALYTPETEREAFYLLHYFGPDTYGEIIGSDFRPQNRESVSLMVMRLMSEMPLEQVTPYLSNLMEGGPVTVRLQAVKYLCEQGFVPGANQRQRIEDIINGTVYNIGRLIALQTEAERNRYFILSGAIGWEKNMNYELLFSLLSLTSGNATTGLIRTNAASGTADGAGIASEVIETMITGSLRRSLQALLGHNSDRARLNELSLYFPIRQVTDGSLATMILSSDQNITGVWTKACALHRAAREGRGVAKEIVVSYLFSNSQLLQEEAAMVIRTVDRDWFTEVEGRLTEQVRNRVTGVVNNTLPEVAMIFGKTRFLSLCFNKIPEERMIMLASCMRYSESYDAGPLPGLITWIVPSDQGNSGLYSLPVSDITNFVFHYSEYTDIFADYIDKQSTDAV
jgi:hypothetical protein